MRKVTIYSSNLGNGLSFDTDVKSFGQLQTVFMEKGVSYSNMKVVIGETRVTLEHPDAVLPESDFKVFLLPTKTKSGGISRSEIYNAIKKLKSEKGDAFVKETFGNYTQTSSEDLIKKLASVSITSNTDDIKPGVESAKIDVKNSSEEKVCECGCEKILLEIKGQVELLVCEVAELRLSLSQSTQDEDIEEEEEDEEEETETVYEKEAGDLLDFFQ
jgi:hypothetical protein